MNKTAIKLFALFAMILVLSIVEHYTISSSQSEITKDIITTLFKHMRTMIVLLIAAFLAQHLLHQYAKERENRERRIKAIEDLLIKSQQLVHDFSIWGVNWTHDSYMQLHKFSFDLLNIRSLCQIYFESLASQCDTIIDQLSKLDKQILVSLPNEIAERYGLDTTEEIEISDFSQDQINMLKQPFQLHKLEIESIVEGLTELSNTLIEEHKNVENQ